MSILTSFNAEVARYLPVWAWDWLQITFGLAVFWGTFAQREFSPRFSWKDVRCTVDSVTTWIAQAALSIVACIALMVAFDGMQPGDAPPRTFVVIFLFAYLMIQLRIIYQALAVGIHKLVNVGI